MASLQTTHRRLEGKVVIVTGGASGIGASTVTLFWEHGASLVIADIRDEPGLALARKLGERASYIHCDVSNEDDVANLVDTAVAKHGRLDVMYNNAGVIDGSVGSILDSTLADMDRVIGVNLYGAFLGAKHAARVMVPQRGGCILFTTSSCTAIAGAGASHPYTASKCAIVGLARSLAAELGQHGIRVNCIAPHGVAGTDIMSGLKSRVPMPELSKELLGEMSHLKGQVLEAESVARVALFLASDDAHYVSGLNLVVDGGFSVVNPSLMMALKAHLQR